MIQIMQYFSLSNSAKMKDPRSGAQNSYFEGFFILNYFSVKLYSVFFLYLLALAVCFFGEGRLPL